MNELMKSLYDQFISGNLKIKRQSQGRAVYRYGYYYPGWFDIDKNPTFMMASVVKQFLLEYTK